jgi:hypothetical protein
MPHQSGRRFKHILKIVARDVWMKAPSRLAALLLAVSLAGAAGAQAREVRNGGKLLLTSGVSTIEGAAGGGLASWAVIAGHETRDGVGATANATLVTLPDYQFRAVGAAVGVFDRLELSYAHQSFDTQGTGAKLGLGRGFTFEQDVVGAKLRVAGDTAAASTSMSPRPSSTSTRACC